MKRTASTKDWCHSPHAAPAAANFPPGKPFKASGSISSVDPGGQPRTARTDHAILKFHLEQTYRTPFVTGPLGTWCVLAMDLLAAARQPGSQARVARREFRLLPNCSSPLIRTRTFSRLACKSERGYAAGPEAAKSWGLRPDFDWLSTGETMPGGERPGPGTASAVLREGFRRRSPW